MKESLLRIKRKNKKREAQQRGHACVFTVLIESRVIVRFDSSMFTIDKRKPTRILSKYYTENSQLME